jgi:hypothetical protein
MVVIILATIFVSFEIFIDDFNSFEVRYHSVIPSSFNQNVDYLPFHLMNLLDLN